MPYSKSVLDSYQKYKDDWGGFYVPAGVLALPVFFCLAAFFYGPFTVNLIAAFIFVACVLTYFRLLGRLGSKLTKVTLVREHSQKE
jgi:hypothetical protein